MRGLYAIVDVASLERRSLEVLPFADAVLRARPAAIQLRDKRGQAGATLTLLRALQLRAREAGVPLLANDRPDLAALAGCAGVHVGQQDLPVEAARQVLSALGVAPLVGISAHDEAELGRALEAGPDYVALGPVFATRSKANHEPVIGLEGLGQLAERARQRCPAIPCVAIGGIDEQSASAVARHCPCAAVIGALLPKPSDRTDRYDEVARRAARLHRALQETP